VLVIREIHIYAAWAELYYNRINPTKSPASGATNESEAWADVTNRDSAEVLCA